MLNEQHQLFVEKYVELAHGTQAAIAAGYSENGAHVTASRLLKTVKIQEAIQELREERQAEMRQRFVAEADNAMRVLLSIMNDEEVSPQTRYNAAKDVLDRAGYKPSDKVEHSGKQELEITDAKQQLMDKITKLREVK